METPPVEYKESSERLLHFYKRRQEIVQTPQLLTCQTFNAFKLAVTQQLLTIWTTYIEIQQLARVETRSIKKKEPL